ncbi:MAG TPA: GIY-YIG nuclease family protein [Methanocorpusculum sp.]|nr:GIY-YIG nuclease family protein [Methanocorpusculum sp.]
MAEKAGVIYILTNPSFPDYVKIGYARDIEQRLSQLNQSECIPYAFRVYAIYETTEPLQDKRLHALIDQLNPELRSVEVFDGKKRIREFYAVSAEDAYNILEAIAEISGTKDRLKRMKPEGHEIADEECAEEIRSGVITFTKCSIPVGAEIQFVDHPEIKAKVVDDRNIEYNGEVGSMSSFAREFYAV